MNITNFKGFSRFKEKFLSFFPNEAFKEGYENKCWIYKGGKTGAGYGKIYWNTSYLAHRLSYIIFNGPIASGLLVRHTCDNPACVNPKHLVLGNHQDNSSDMVKRNRQGSQKLNSEAVKVIKWMLKYQNHYGLVRKLAKLYKMSPDQISRINNSKHWNWIKV